MSGGEFRRRLKAVDPELKVVPGMVSHGRLKGRQNWNHARGGICQQCGAEYFRGRDGLCYQCWEGKNELEVRIPGDLDGFLPMSVLQEIVHPSRKE